MALVLQPAGGMAAIEMIGSWRGLENADVFVNETIRNVAAGLAYIHSKNILHCDVKPENLAYVSYSPVHVIIIDFGASVMAATSIDHMKGTVLYLAPEVMRLKELKEGDPKESYSFPADMWSLGVTLLEFLEGVKNTRAIGRSICEEWLATKLLAWVEERKDDQKLRELTQRLLDWEPRRRMTATEVEEFLTPAPAVVEGLLKVELTSFDGPQSKRLKNTT